jgi:hypothetical protein
MENFPPENFPPIRYMLMLRELKIICFFHVDHNSCILISAIIVVISCIAAYLCTFWLDGNHDEAPVESPSIRQVLYTPSLVNGRLDGLFLIGFYVIPSNVQNK